MICRHESALNLKRITQVKYSYLLIFISLHFRYIIDVGCGNADEVSTLAKEFFIICLDQIHNTKKATLFHPEIHFIDTNLDIGSNCSVDIPKHILIQSVILSADVIEHIVDPKVCYLPILKYFMNFSAALVLSTPQRSK